MADHLASLVSLSHLPSTYDPAKTVYMLNKGKYRQEAMGRYRTAIAPLLPPNTSVFLSSTVLAKIAAPDDENWDFVVILKYETLEGFKKMVECNEYRQEVEPHRLAGLEDHRLILLDRLEA